MINRDNTLKKLSAFRNFLDLNNISYKKNHILKYETYFKMGGRIHSFVMPKNIDEMKKLLNYLSENVIEYKIIGLTTNIFILDELEYSIIISTKNLNSIEITSDTIKIDCGFPIEDFVRITLLESSTGYEGLEGIPGSIGGAIIMNAGAYGYTISDNLVNVMCLNPKKEIVLLTKEECHFQHRSSRFKGNDNWVILSASFKLISSQQSLIAHKIEKYHIARHLYQEFSYPNLGSLFSVKGDFYQKFFEQSLLNTSLLFVLKLLYKNPISKFIMRKRPNNVVFNNLVNRYISPERIPHAYSTKSMNILLNNGTSTFYQIIDYITLLRKNLNTEHSLENEIVISPLLKKDERAKEILNYLKVRGLSK